MVASGTTPVPEELEIFSFYALGGGFEFLTVGTNLYCSNPLDRSAAARLEARTLRAQVPSDRPARRTVLGGRDAAVEAIDITLGSAVSRHGYVQVAAGY